jgi:dihydrofolate reductase
MQSSMISSKPILTIVVAVADNGVIGNKGRLPWNISADLKRVKELTVGKPLLMGRKTYESIGKPLPNRKTIVLTRDNQFSVPEVPVYSVFSEAFDGALTEAVRMKSDEVVAFGGARIYEAALPLTQKIYKTEVHCSPQGDTYFPKYDEKEWREIAREYFPGGYKDEYPFSFVCLTRIPLD